MNAITDTMAQDESNEHNELTKETISGGSNQNGIFYSTKHNY